VISNWRDYADADSPLPFISAFSTSTGATSVSYAGTGTDAILTGKTWKPKTILQMKIVATSTYSTSTGKTIEDTFLLTMSDRCAANKIALDASLANSNGGTAIIDFAYLIGSGSTVKKPLISAVETNANCPITSKLYVFDPSQNVWID
jgi:hypothetical protein